ncbi:MAG TPA: hypothetical protein VLA05_04130 [Coriobacteriia bacterium]|nr:hypothetical protein [Coriobacteriia bacterium]
MDRAEMNRERQPQVLQPSAGDSERAKHSPLSPVDQILALPPQARSLLDTRPAGRPVPKWMWLLPLTFALPGGIVGWLLVKDSNQAAARGMLVIGAIATLFTALTLGPTKAFIGTMGM